MGGVTTGSPERLSAAGMGEGAAESLELTLWPSEPKSLANFTWDETECTGLPFHTVFYLFFCIWPIHIGKSKKCKGQRKWLVTI